MPKKTPYGWRHQDLVDCLGETPEPAIHTVQAECFQCGREARCVILVWTPTATTEVGFAPVCCDCLNMASLIIKHHAPAEGDAGAPGFHKVAVLRDHKEQ
jgi:hypothetical protein